MRRNLLLMIVVTLVPGFAGCRSPSDYSATEGTAVTQTLAKQTVEAGCGSCIFNMQGVEGCELAVRIDGKPYLVTGADVDAHGSGLCRAAKEAKAVGKIEGDKFVATSFELQP